MTILFTLLVTVVMTPTLVDRSDLASNCGVTTARKTISQQPVNGGFVQGVVSVDIMGAVGMIDNSSARYDPCNEFGERFFQPAWVVSATVSPNEGLAVFENGKLVFNQHKPYKGATAVIRVQQSGESLRYYLNGRLLFTSKHIGSSVRDLRAYYFETVASPLIGTTQTRITKHLRKVRWLNLERSGL